ncbi:MAG: glycosyltransferase [Terrimicrobiaceae bacterium]
MSEPVISVLMTVFNAGRFFDPSIRSILNQTFRNFEFLIVDDASTDGSTDAAETWAARDPRIRVIRNQDNKGQTACLNQGLSLARGRWIARQDADDLAHPLRLARQHRFLTVCPDVVLLGTNGRIIDAHDRLVGLLDAPLSQQGITWTSPFLNPFMHTSVMVRADIIRDKFGGYNEDYRIAQDYELWTRVIATHSGANLPQRLVCYRHLPASLSKAGRDVAFAEAGQVSAREARRVFGRSLNEREAELLAAFREGLDPGSRRAFWQLYEELLSNRDARTGDIPRTVAMHHLKAAGALSSNAPGAAAGEILKALCADFRATLGWLATRYLNA